MTDNASNMLKAEQLNEWTRLQCLKELLSYAIGKLALPVPTYE